MQPTKTSRRTSSSGPESPRLGNPYGYFDVGASEYVITNPQTPAPWVNYLTNGRYTALHSHTSGGFSFFRSAKDSRITRWRYNSLPMDRPGRYLYFRNRKNGEVWSPSWQPTFTPLDRFECRHGMNYSRLYSSYQNIEVRALYFVPRDADCEIWWFTLNNVGKQAAYLDVFAYVELCLGHALVDLINQPNDQHFNDVHYSAAEEILLATKRYWVTYNGPTVAQANKEWDTVAWMALGLPVKGFDGSKDQFIGRWRSEEHPLAVDQGHCFNSEITSGDAVAALQSDLEIQPGDTRQFAVLLGAVPKEGALESARVVARKYRSNANIAAAFEELKKFNQDYLSGFQCVVPDPEMQLMLNFWNQYQTKTTFQFSRDASYYHGGLLFGRGYRDSCQDLLGPLLTQPVWALARIKEMAAYQFQSGKTYHCYYPLTGGGEVTGHTDTPLWLPFAACWYFRETGELDKLSEPIRFVDGGEAPLLDHLLRALDCSLSQISPRGLALFGPGDWNDTLDYCGRGGKGESIWVSLFQCYVMKELIGLLREIGHERADHYEIQYQRLKETINQLAWDGEWYLRGTNDLGEPVGSSKCDEGRIFLNAQSWAVISGVADGERAQRCMDSVMQHLATPKGPKILHPPYTRPNPNIGLATRCVPGKKENGAVFNHPVAWAILAEIILGRPEQALEYYRAALPFNPEIPIDQYGVEPYVYAEYVTSPDHPTYGQASHSWLTGSSTWMLRSQTDFLLGIRPDYKGLLVDPCIPRGWTEYKILRKFRRATYDISVKNPHGLSRGRVRLVLDGQSIDSNLLPALSDGATHVVEATLEPQTSS